VSVVHRDTDGYWVACKYGDLTHITYCGQPIPEGHRVSVSLDPREITCVCCVAGDAYSGTVYNFGRYPA
jgi:hypothetical protein